MTATREPTDEFTTAAFVHDLSLIAEEVAMPGWHEARIRDAANALVAARMENDALRNAIEVIRRTAAGEGGVDLTDAQRADLINAALRKIPAETAASIVAELTTLRAVVAQADKTIATLSANWLEAEDEIDALPSTPGGGEWQTRERMPTEHQFIAAWLDTGEIEQIELLVNSRGSDGKTWLNQNSGNYINDTWELWMPLPLPAPPGSPASRSVSSPELIAALTKVRELSSAAGRAALSEPANPLLSSSEGQ